MYDLLIVSDVRLYREGLDLLLGGRDEVHVVGTAVNFNEADRAIRETQPCIVLIDMLMRDSLGIVERLVSLSPDLRIIALSLPEMDSAVVACAEAGVSGYVTRDSSVNELVDAIAAAADGEIHCSPKVVGSLFRRVSTLSMNCRKAPLKELTTREIEVLQLIERDFSNKQIANDLGVELSTAKNHVHNLLEKLGVHRRGEAAALLRRGPSSQTTDLLPAMPNPFCDYRGTGRDA